MLNKFPEEARPIGDQEGQAYFNNMVFQIVEWNPDEIIAVSRSGFSFGMWTSQILDIPLGAYFPKEQILIKNPKSKRVVFIDDNVVKGTTVLQATEFMKQYPDIEWTWATLFCDWFTSKEIRNNVIHGTRLPFYATEPFWGSQKIAKGYDKKWL